MDAITPAKAEHDPLAHYRWTARVFVVLAADPESPDLAEQKRQIESLKDGAAERELVVVQPPAGSAEAKAFERGSALAASRSRRCWWVRMGVRSSRCQPIMAQSWWLPSMLCRCGRTKCAGAPARRHRRAARHGPHQLGP